MNKKIDSNFFKVLSVLLGLSFVFSVVMFTISAIDIIKNESLFSDIFDIIYFAIHLLINFLGFMFAIKAIKNESFIIKNLTHDRYNEHQVSKTAFIIAIIFLVVMSAMLVYDLLIIFNPNIHDFNFSLTLKLVILSVSIFVIIVAINFLIYPKVIHR